MGCKAMSDSPINFNIDDINIEDIMDQIRKNIKERGMLDEELPALEKLRELNNNSEIFSISDLKENIALNNMRWNINIDTTIQSHKKILGKLIVLIKRAIRKSIRWFIKPIVEQQVEFNSSVTRTLNEVNRFINQSQKDAQVKKQDISKLYDEISRIDKNYKDFSGQQLKPLDFDYLSFENKYRGTELQIKEKMKVYLDYYKEATEVLDIGCGRGEFVELLVESGVKAQGIDINDDMVLYCQKKGLPVIKEDCFEYLSNLEDCSLGGIFLGQVIEHLSPKELINLVKIAYKKLKPGAYFIAETINPQCLLVFTESYFLDITHERLIHPYTIKFILESEGFNDLSIKYMSKVDEEFKIPELKIDNVDNIKHFNMAMQNLNNIIFSYRDYAVIGRK